jgi:hypothetical protein
MVIAVNATTPFSGYSPASEQTADAPGGPLVMPLPVRHPFGGLFELLLSPCAMLLRQKKEREPQELHHHGH